MGYAGVCSVLIHRDLRDVLGIIVEPLLGVHFTRTD